MEETNKKNTGGRPQKEELIKQKYPAKCHLDYFENEQLKSYKKRYDFKTSEVVKMALLEHLKIARKKSNELSTETLELFTELRRTNHLLNQVAKMLNTGLQLDGKQTLEFFKIVTRLEKNSKSIINQLEN